MDCVFTASLSTDHPHLEASLKMISVAQHKSVAEDFEGALDKYELALGALIKILHEEPKGRRRDLIQKYVSDHFDSY